MQKIKKNIRTILKWAGIVLASNIVLITLLMVFVNSRDKEKTPQADGQAPQADVVPAPVPGLKAEAKPEPKPEPPAPKPSPYGHGYTDAQLDAALAYVRAENPKNLFTIGWSNPIKYTDEAKR